MKSLFIALSAFSMLAGGYAYQNKGNCLNETCIRNENCLKGECIPNQNCNENCLKGECIPNQNCLNQACEDQKMGVQSQNRGNQRRQQRSLNCRRN